MRAMQKEFPAVYGTQTRLARLTGLDQTSWSHYLSGKSIPSKLARRAIQNALGIPVGLWDVAATTAANDHAHKLTDLRRAAQVGVSAESELSREGAIPENTGSAA